MVSSDFINASHEPEHMVTCHVSIETPATNLEDLRTSAREILGEIFVLNPPKSRGDLGEDLGRVSLLGKS